MEGEDPSSPPVVQAAPQHETAASRPDDAAAQSCLAANQPTGEGSGHPSTADGVNPAPCSPSELPAQEPSAELQPEAKPPTQAATEEQAPPPEVPVVERSPEPQAPATSAAAGPEGAEPSGRVADAPEASQALPDALTNGTEPGPSSRGATPQERVREAGEPAEPAQRDGAEEAQPGIAREEQPGSALEEQPTGGGLGGELPAVAPDNATPGGQGMGVPRPGRLKSLTALNGTLGRTLSDGTHILPAARPQTLGNGISMATANGGSPPGQVFPVNGLAEGGLEEEEAVLKFTPGNKRRRTTVGRPQTSKSPGNFLRGFLSEDGPTGAEEGGDVGPDDLLEALKGSYRGEVGLERVRLGQILRSGLLVGQPVEYRAADGKGINISGRVTQGGKISCGCSECEGETVSLLEFEEHAGAWERYQTENVHLTRHNLTLKEVWLAINAECAKAIDEGDLQGGAPQQTRRCHVCELEGVGLLRCSGCKKRGHAACVGRSVTGQAPWLCMACMEERQAAAEARVVAARAKVVEARSKAAKRSLEALQRGDGPEARRLSNRQQDTPGRGRGRGRGSRPSTGGRGSGSKPQRVHMAAPTAKVGLRQGRLARNSNKHKRLFDPDEPNGVKNGEKVVYQTSQGEKLLHGEIRVDRDGPCGILCECCNKVISCSQFEAHAGRGSRRAPYDNIMLNGITLRRLAAALPSEELVYHHHAAAAPEDEQDTVQEDMLGGCVLCEEKNFQREGFSDLTVILCDQCEREFHVGCLRQHKGINLEGLPEGDWFCAEACQRIHGELRLHVAAGPMTIDADYQWQLLHGKDGSHGTTWALKACYEILQESFDPIIDQVSRQDLVKGMVYSEQQGEWDHTGMFTAILRHKKHPVCALVMRAFGNMLAEVPLIATRLDARRKGHARYLMTALESLLAQVGVRTLSLPAAHSTVDTWTKGFGFVPMAADQLLETRESLRLLVFPGTEVLHKVLLPNAPPYPCPRADKVAEHATTADAKTTPAEMEGVAAEKGEPPKVPQGEGSHAMEVDGAPQQEAGPPNPDPGPAEPNPLQEVGEAAALQESAQEDTQMDVEGEPQKAASPQDGPVDAAETGGVKDEEMPDAQPGTSGVGEERPACGSEGQPALGGGGGDTVLSGEELQQDEGVVAVTTDSERLGQSPQPPPLLEV